MVGLPFDCLTNPLGAVRSSFEKAVSGGLNPATFDGKDWGAVDVFRDFLFDHGALSAVPILDQANIRRVQPNTLVRFRGMVQDMLGNEFYVGTFKDGLTWRTNKFTDIASCPMALKSEMRIWERRLLYCTPVPGQNSWIMESLPPSEIVRNSNWTSQHGEKRPRDAATDDMDLSALDHELRDSSSSTKKQREDGLASELFQTPQESVIQDTFPELGMLPDLSKNSLPCLVKIYDSLESDLKLNDVFEFIGVFTFDPELVVHREDSDELSNDLGEDVSVRLPPSKVPRLHCITYRKLAAQDFLSNSHIVEPMPSLVKGIREALLGHLTAVFGNDGLAAQCVLLHLLSRVHARVGTVAMGKLSLNLTGLSRESVSIFGHRINLAIQGLLPFSQSMPLTVEYLNTASLAPRKDYQTNRLIAGVLQLAQGTHLTIDETQLKTGMLNASGVENARLLKNLMELQKVEYEFEYYKMEMDADVQVLILSEGKSNILPTDLLVPFQPGHWQEECCPQFFFIPCVVSILICDAFFLITRDERSVYVRNLSSTISVSDVE